MSTSAAEGSVDHASVPNYYTLSRVFLLGMAGARLAHLVLDTVKGRDDMNLGAGIYRRGFSHRKAFSQGCKIVEWFPSLVLLDTSQPTMAVMSASHIETILRFSSTIAPA